MIENVDNEEWRMDEAEHGPSEEKPEEPRAERDLYVVLTAPPGALVLYNEGDRIPPEHVGLPTIPAVRDASGVLVPVLDASTPKKRAARRRPS